MKNKSLILAIFLVLVVFLGSSAVFAENSSDIQSATADEIELQQNNIDNALTSNYTINAGATSEEIQNTINSMSDGDTLNFEEGNYADVCIYINKSITVNGNGANLIGYDNPSASNVPEIIKNSTSEGGYGIGNVATLYIVSNNVTISGLTITAGANSGSETAGPAYSNALVYAEYSNNLIFENNVVDGSSWGIYLRFSHDCQIVENIIKNQAVTGLLSFGSARTQIERNTVIDAKNHGIDVRHGTGPNVQVINNTISGSKEGIYLMHSQGHTAAFNTIENCTISSISCYGSSNVEIYNNTMKKSRIGIFLSGHSNITVGTNTWALDNLPYPPTFVYYILDTQSNLQSATNMMGTHSDSSTYNPIYVAYEGIDTPDEIVIDYNTILAPTGTTYPVPEGTSSENIQKMIASMNDGDTLSFEENAVYENISIYIDKNIKIIGNNATLVGYDNLDLTNCPAKITATSADGGYAISERAVLYVVNNTNAVVTGLNIVAQFPGYNPNTVVGTNTIEYKTAGIRTQNAVNVTITDCTIDGASWGIYAEYSTNAIITNNDIKNQFTTGILNFGTGYSIIANNTITDAVNHGIDVRHGTGPSVTVFNNTISGSKEGIYLMHSGGHNVYNNTITNAKISGITCYGSYDENVFNNSISGSRIGIILGGGYHGVTIGENTYDLDFLPFPPTFVTYLAKAEQKYASASNAMGTYYDAPITLINAEDLTTDKTSVQYTFTLTNKAGKGIANQTVTVTIDGVDYPVETDANGTGTVETTLAYGSYPVTITYPGATTYSKTMATATLTVAEVAPANNTVEAVQAAIDSAVAGDTVDLSKFADYDFVDQTVNITTAGITIDGRGITTIKGYGDGSGIFAVKAQNVTIKGINFIDTNPQNDFKYNGTTAGWGISVNGGNGGLVQNCNFTEFNAAVVIMGTTGYTVDSNNFNGGYTTKLLNDPTVNKETGSKSLNIYRQSSKVVVTNNVFNGPILDGVSIAQGSGSNQVIGNTFIGNCYSIYFGGASTVGSTIAENTFINCGFFKEGNISWTGLPVISMQKASDGVSVENNTFYAIADNVLIAAEKGNEAHGYPSEIGDINITDNTVVPYDSNDISGVTLFHILVRDNNALDVTSPIVVSGNALNGAKGVSIWFDGVEILTTNNDITLNSVLYSDSLFGTTLTVDDLTVLAGKAGVLTATLKDSNGAALANRAVSIIIDGVTKTATTNDEGIATLDVNYASATTKYVTVAYAGESNVYKSSFGTAKITVNKNPTTLTAAKATLKVNKAKKVKVTLKSSGKAVANKKVTIKVNGKTFSGKTNAKGIATISVKVAKAGTFNAVVKFAGDSAYKAASKTVKYTVKK